MQSSSEPKPETQAKILLLHRKIKDDPVEWIKTFCWTFNPKREPFHFPFDLYPFQVELVRDLVRAIEQGYDIFLDKTREMGATYTVLAVLYWYWINRDASNFLIGSRKEDIVDNTGQRSDGEVNNKEESLFGKLDYMIMRTPDVVLPNKFSILRHRTYMSLLNPEMGNVIAGESSNPNFSRGGRQKAIMLDEFAFWDNDTSAWGSTADTTNCRIVLTTPGIRPNTKAKRLRFGLDGEKIKTISLPYHLDPTKDDKWLQDQRDRRSKEDFAREIMIDWEGSTKGIVYPEARQRDVGTFPYVPDWPLYVTWDFGLDGTAIQWWQPNPINGRMRLIESLKRVNKPIQWFFPFFGNDIDSEFVYEQKDLDAMYECKNFKKAVHYGDPDASKRSMTSRTLTSVRRELEEVNIYVQTNPMANSFSNRREMTKVLLQKGIEVNATPENTGIEGWLECIDNARYPQRPDNSQATTEITLPIHDYTSHHRTATEYFAVNYKEKTSERQASVVTSAQIPNSDSSFLVDDEGNIVDYKIDMLEAAKASAEIEQDYRYL